MEQRNYPGRGADQFVLRLPDGMRDRIAAIAKANGRSMNTEIVRCLEAGFGRMLDIDHAQLLANREAADASARASFIAGSKPPIYPPVSIKELATRLQMDRSACRQYVLRLGYKPTKQRMADSGYQLALTITAAEAFDIQKKRAAEGYCSPPR